MTDASVRDAAWHDALVDKHEEEIVTMLSRRLTRDQVDAARDLAQKTFSTAWSRRYDVPDDPRPWLFKTADNHLRNHWRRSLRVRPELLGQDVLANALDRHPMAAAAEQVVDIRRALAHVGKRDRRILFMAHVEGWKSDEIAAVEGLTPEAVRKRLSRASQVIRQALGTDYPRADHGDRRGESR